MPVWRSGTSESLFCRHDKLSLAWLCSSWLCFAWAGLDQLVAASCGIVIPAPAVARKGLSGFGTGGDVVSKFQKMSIKAKERLFQNSKLASCDRSTLFVPMMCVLGQLCEILPICCHFHVSRSSCALSVGGGGRASFQAGHPLGGGDEFIVFLPSLPALSIHANGTRKLLAQ